MKRILRKIKNEGNLLIFAKRRKEEQIGVTSSIGNGGNN